MSREPGQGGDRPGPPPIPPAPTSPAQLRAVDPNRSYEGTSGDEYDPDAFYVRSVDTHGHSDRLRVRIHPDVMAEIARMLASGAFAGTPLKTFSDVVRDALVHQMHRLARLTGNPDIAALAQIERRLAMFETHRQDREKHIKIVEDARAQFEEAMKAEDIINLGVLVVGYEELIEGMREPYRGQLEGCLTGARRWLETRKG